MRIIILLLCFILFELVSSSTAPSFCRSYDCPKFTKVNTSDSFETRNYTSAKWLTTKVQAPCFEAAARRGFRPIFEYIRGNNDKNTTLNMTVPIVTAIKPGLGIYSNYSLGYFLPSKYQDSPPEPKCGCLSFYTNKASSLVAVRSFGGYALTLKLKLELTKLLKKVKDAKIAFNPHIWFSAVYNAPFEKHNRHNEVWLLINPEEKYDHDHITAEQMFKFDSKMAHEEKDEQFLARTE